MGTRVKVTEESEERWHARGKEGEKPDGTQREAKQRPGEVTRGGEVVVGERQGGVGKMDKAE